MSKEECGWREEWGVNNQVSFRSIQLPQKLALPRYLYVMSLNIGGKWNNLWITPGQVYTYSSLQGQSQRISIKRLIQLTGTAARA